MMNNIFLVFNFTCNDAIKIKHYKKNKLIVISMKCSSYYIFDIKKHLLKKCASLFHANIIKYTILKY